MFRKYRLRREARAVLFSEGYALFKFSPKYLQGCGIFRNFATSPNHS